MPLSNQLLAQLADAYGISTQFWDWKGRSVDVGDETVIGILAGMEVDASTPEAAQAALDDLDARPWRRALPPFVITEQGAGVHVTVHVDAGVEASLLIRLEDGGTREAFPVHNWTPDRWVDGRLVGEGTFWIPENLPLGYHRLQLSWGDRTAESTLAVSPHFLGLPAGLADRRSWGYAAQLYSVRSRDSWGMGDLQDLADLAVFAATQHFAHYVLVNPLHAAEPRTPLEPSPYLPSSRRYVNPLYIRPESIQEYAFLSDKRRDKIEQLRKGLRRRLAGSDRIERNPVWEAKLAALRVVHRHGLSEVRRMAFDDFRRREGRPLRHFATWCALVAEHGMDWRSWPAEFRRPSSPAVAGFTEAHEAQIEFFEWLQWIADTQLRQAQSAARDAGMRIGVMTDLAVGVSRDSAEAWTLGDSFAQGVSVGAPPDHYNQLGQDWGQAPWRPDRLEDLAYGPFRAMVAGNLRHSGGLRIDHIMGLFRLWWIPQGMAARDGAYVRYNHEAMVGIVVLEAHRAGALVVGEDLGTVEPWVRTYLRDRGLLGTSVAWFEAQDDGQPLPPEAYREYCMASVTTHDMPPTAGYLALEHLELQSSLGLLTEPREVEEANAVATFARWQRLLTERGLLREGDDPVEEFVLAMHRFLLQTPSRVLCAALVDAVGDRRMQNQPGTVDEYPNWRVPLSGPDGRAMALEDVYVSERAQRLATVMNGFSTPVIGRR